MRGGLEWVRLRGELKSFVIASEAKQSFLHVRITNPAKRTARKDCFAVLAMTNDFGKILKKNVMLPFGLHDVLFGQFGRLAGPTVRTGGLKVRATFLPDAGLLGGGALHLIGGLAAEGFVELGHVHQRAVGAELGRRVRVGKYLLASGFGPDVGAPDLAPG